MESSFLPLIANATLLKTLPPLGAHSKIKSISKPPASRSCGIDRVLSISAALVTLIACTLWLRQAHLHLKSSSQNATAAFATTDRPLSFPPFGTLVLYCEDGQWYGRTGNIIISVLSAALRAHVLGMDFKVVDCSHDRIDLSQLSLDPGSDNFDIKDTLRPSDAFTTFVVSTKMRILPKDACCLRKQILAPLLKKIASSPAASKYHPDSLIIHIRSGDAYGKSAHPNYVPPVLTFYTRVIEDYQRRHSSASIVIVTELDHISPLVEALLKLYPQGTITLQAGSLEEDVAVVLGARHLVASQGTFAYALAYASERLETLYEFNKNLDTRIFCDIDLIRYKAVRPASMEKWAATAEQIQYLLNFPAENITRTTFKGTTLNEIIRVLLQVSKQQEEQGKQLAALCKLETAAQVPWSETAPAGGALLKAVGSRANKKIKVDGGTAVSVAEAETALYEGVEGAAMVAACAVESETQRRRVTVFQEFASWLVPRKKVLGLNEDPYQATPEDLVAYHHNYWILNHGETQLKGRLWPAPGSLEGNFSYLSGVFESVGRQGIYNTQLGMGNPVLSKLVRDYKEGYARLLRDIGYATTSAVHMKEEKLLKVILMEEEKLKERRAALDWKDRGAVIKYLLMERDILMLCGVWQCSSRGKEMGVLEKERVQDRDGHSLYPRIVVMEINAGVKYQIAPKGTKKIQRNRAGVILLEAEVEERSVLCLLRKLQEHARSCLAAGITESKFIVRAETSNHIDLKDEGLSSSNMNKRMQYLLKKYGLFEGETLHGIRRGSMQQARAMGQTVEEVGARALQVTRAVTVAYLDTSRETNGPQRIRGGRNALND